MRTISSRIGLAIVVGALAVSGVARAGDDEPKAMQLFEKGRKLAKDGRCAEALAPFQESLKYAEGVGTLLNLGNCYETLGKTASAHRSFLRAVDVATAKNDDKRIAEARERAKAVEKDVSSLLVHVPINLKSTAEIRVDGDPWPKERWDVPWPIDPGVHDIEVIAPPRPKQTESVTVKPHGDHADWAVVTKDPATSPVPPSPPSSKRVGNDSSSDHDEGGSTQRTLGLVSGGVGAAGVVSGIIFGLVSLSAHSSLTSTCPTYPHGCDPANRSSLDATNDNAKLTGNVSTISFIAGAILLAAGAGLYFTAKPAR